MFQLKPPIHLPEHVRENKHLVRTKQDGTPIEVYIIRAIHPKRPHVIQYDKLPPTETLTRALTITSPSNNLNTAYCSYPHNLTMACHSLKPAIGASVLSFNLAFLNEEVRKRVTPFIQKEDYVHLDVMDGNFVDAITFGSATIKVWKECYTSAAPFSERVVITCSVCVRCVI